MKAWGRYELVASPADADLLLEIQFTVFPAQSSGRETLGGIAYDPQFRLAIRDSKTQAILWGLTEHAQWAILKGNRDKNFDQALAHVVSEVRRIATGPAAGEASKQ